MKFGILGDTHFTNRGPSRRKDNFFETQMEKLSEAFEIFKRYNCSFVFQPGDLFDSHTVSNQVKANLIEFLRNQKRDFPILCVSGQHDISGHSLYTLRNSPLAVLQSAGVLKILSGKRHVELLDGLDKPLVVYGASYGEPIPKPTEDWGEVESTYNVLVIHKMIGDRELFPGQDLTKPNQFLRNNPGYDLVICGDYHYRFRSQYQGRTIINAGCLVRKTISKFDLEHRPSVAIFDTDTKDAFFEELEIRPVEEVFDLSREVKTDNEAAKKLIEELRKLHPELGSDQPKRVNWKNLIHQVLKNKKIADGDVDRVRQVIDKCLEKVQK